MKKEKTDEEIFSGRWDRDMDGEHLFEGQEDDDQDDLEEEDQELERSGSKTIYESGLIFKRKENGRNKA